MLNEDVTVSFIKIDKETFIDQCAEANIDITVNMLELFNELFK